jgi:hypothetical protein
MLLKAAIAIRGMAIGAKGDRVGLLGFTELS